MPRGTPLRAVRVPDPLWVAARKVANQRGDNLSDIIRDALEQYVRRNTTDTDKREIRS